MAAQPELSPGLRMCKWKTEQRAMPADSVSILLGHCVVQPHFEAERGVLSDGNADLLNIVKQECIRRPSARIQGLWAGHQSAAKPGMFVEDRAGSQMQVRRHGVLADGKPLCALSWKSALEEVRVRVSEGQGNGSLGWHSGTEVQEIGPPQWPQVHRTLLQEEQGHQGRGGLGLTAPEHTDLS